MKFSTFEKVGFGLLVAAWVVWGSHQISGFLVHATELEKPAYAVEVADVAPAKSNTPAVVENAITLLASASLDKGAKVFKKCKSCHTVNKGGKNGVGPNLWNVVGKAKASVDGYAYSGVLQGLGGEWSYENLDSFLVSPKGYAKGTKMSFAGLKKAGDRAAVIAYLRSLSDSPKPLP